MKLTKEEKKEIYTKALVELKSHNRYYERGICSCLSQVTNYDIEFLIKKDFKQNKPSIWKPKTWKFRFHKNYQVCDVYWWTQDEEGYNQRIKFLEYLIEKTVKMKYKFIKDLPIYLNGLAVGMLFWAIPNIGFVDIACAVLAMITFFWWGEQQKRNG
jgi:hypothetical protein